MVGLPAVFRQVPASLPLAGAYSLSDPVALTAGPSVALLDGLGDDVDGRVTLGDVDDSDGSLGVGVGDGPDAVTTGALDAGIAEVAVGGTWPHPARAISAAPTAIAEGRHARGGSFGEPVGAFTRPCWNPLVP